MKLDKSRSSPIEGNIIYSSSITRFSRGSVLEAEADIDTYLKNN